jgi:predicted permease
MSMLDDLKQDLRFAARTLARSPGFTAVAILAIALGIGANSALFSVVDAVLLRPLPYAAPEGLVTVMHDGPALSERQKRRGPVSPADFLEWRAQGRVFQRMAAAQAGAGRAGLTATLAGRGTPEAVTVMSVTADLFPMLGVAAMLGRTLGPGDDQAGAAPVVVLGHGLWQRRFGGDPALVGQTITLGDRTVTVAGVMPAGFQFAPFWFTGAELWMPLVLGDPAHDRTHDRDGRSLRVFARLAPGVTRAQAQAEMDLIWQAQQRSHPASASQQGVAVTSLHEQVVGSLRRPLLVLAAAVAFVLLIGCANVANLLLARAAGRRKELALRIALGASRGRLVRQLLVESLLLACLGGGVALLLAAGAIDALMALGPRGLPRAETIHLDPRALGFTAALALVTGVGFGLLPALQASRLGLGEALKQGGRSATAGRGHGRARGGLVIAEVALALVLLVAAGLLMKSFRKLQEIDPGFEARGVLAMTVSPPATDPDQRQAFFDRLLERVRAVPGVASASAINHLPIEGDVWAQSYAVEGRPPPAPGSEPTAIFRVTRPGYLRTMRIALLGGRDFAEADRADTPPVMIVNEAFARAAWPGEEAVGKRVIFNERSHEIVGVVRDARQKDWAQAPAPELYLADRQAPARGYLTIVVRAEGAAAGLAERLPREVAALDASLPLPRLTTLEQAISASLWQPRFNLLLLDLFAGLALLLAAVGIYGVMAHAVSQRTRELGIRLALGATAGQVRRLVVGQGMALAALGVALGLGGAFATTRLMAALLFGVGATDPGTFALIPALLLGVSFVACYLPARRATRVDPMVALRQE